jgi:hypothetical protein
MCGVVWCGAAAIGQCGQEITGLRARVSELTQEASTLRSQLQFIEQASGDPSILPTTNPNSTSAAYSDSDDEAEGQPHKKKPSAAAAATNKQKQPRPEWAQRLAVMDARELRGVARRFAGAYRLEKEKRKDLEKKLVRLALTWGSVRSLVAAVLIFFFVLPVLCSLRCNQS